MAKRGGRHSPGCRNGRKKYSPSDQLAYHKGWVEGYNDDPRNYSALQHEYDYRRKNPGTSSYILSNFRGNIAGLKAKMAGKKT